MRTVTSRSRVATTSISWRVTVAVVVDRGEHEDAEHVVAVRLEAGPRLVVVARPARAAGSTTVACSSVRDRGLDRRVVGIGEVDPPLGAGHGVTIWVSGHAVADHEPKEKTAMSIRAPVGAPQHPALIAASRPRGPRAPRTASPTAITMFAGSMAFVYLHMLWFAVWIGFRVERYPFGLLTMIVSLEAIFLSTFVMISQNRADAKRQVLADHQWDIVQTEEKQNEDLLDISKQILELTRAIHELTTKSASPPGSPSA